MEHILEHEHMTCYQSRFKKVFLNFLDGRYYNHNFAMYYTINDKEKNVGGNELHFLICLTLIDMAQMMLINVR